MNHQMLAELFGGETRLRALAALFQAPERSFGLRELAVLSDVDSGNLSRWLKRWSEVGLVSRTLGPVPRFQASADPALRPLAKLFSQSGELVRDLQAAIDKLEGVTAAAIFGSFARGEETAGSDIDVLLIGELSELMANARLRPLARQYDRPFNASVFSTAAFQRLLDERDGFALELVSKPHIQLKGSLDEFAKIAQTKES